MVKNTITINPAPVLTLWAAVVAERLGFDEDEALTLGKAVYDRFRPAIPEGVKGWGAKGDLDLALIETLAKSAGSGD